MALRSALCMMAQLHRFASYNPASLVAPQRAHDVSLGMRGFSVVTLQGTCRGAWGRPCFRYRQDAYDEYSFGWQGGTAKQPGTNSSAGVSIFLRRGDWSPRQVLQWWAAPSAVAGRGGALLLQRGAARLLVMSVYFPPKNIPLRWSAERSLVDAGSVDDRHHHRGKEEGRDDLDWH